MSKANDSRVQPQIDELEAELKAYDRILKRRPNDDNTHFAKGGTLVKLGQLLVNTGNTNTSTSDTSKESTNPYFTQALASYAKALELSPSNSLYLSDRSKLHILMDRPDLAAKDIGEAQKSPSSGNKLLDMYTTHTTKDILKLDSVQSEVKKLITSGELPKELEGVFSKMIQVITGISSRVSEHDDRLGSHDEKLSIHDKKFEEQALELQQMKEMLASITQSHPALSAQGGITESISAKINELEAKVQAIDTVLKDSGAADKAHIKQSFDAIAKENPELHAYLKTFYWTTVNLFGAYRYLSTGLIQSNLDSQTNTKEGLLVTGAKKLAAFGADIAKGIPIVGSVLGLLDSIIDDVYDAVKKNRSENKVNSINKIIESKFGLEDDISINIAKMALSMTEARKEVILHPSYEKKSILDKTTNWFESKLGAIKGKILPSVELHDKENKSTELALKDVTLLIAYLCKNYEAIIATKDSFNEQITMIVYRGSLEELLTNIDLSKLQIKDSASSSSSSINSSSSFNNIEQKIGKDEITMIHKKSAEGCWSKGTFTKGKNISEFLEEGYIKTLLGKSTSSHDIEDARVVIFKHICLGAKEAKTFELKLKCVNNFSSSYPELFTKIATKHPELFASTSIASESISNNLLKNQVIAVLVKQEQSTSSSSTQVSAVTEIVYDNELLNHPDLINQAISYFGLNKAVDLSIGLSEELVKEATGSNDTDLVLAGILSLDINSTDFTNS